MNSRLQDTASKEDLQNERVLKNEDGSDLLSPKVMERKSRALMPGFRHRLGLGVAHINTGLGIGLLAIR